MGVIEKGRKEGREREGGLHWTGTGDEEGMEVERSLHQRFLITLMIKGECVHDIYIYLNKYIYTHIIDVLTRSF